MCVSSESKVGKDAGELAGLDVSTGITATNDLEAVLATEPDCAVYCAMADNRMGRAMKDVGRILAGGINVVGSAPVPLQYPWQVLPDKYIAPLEEVAKQANVMGFGTQPDEIPLQLQPGMLSIAWGSSIRQLAAGLGIEVDEITETYEREPAPEAFDIAAGHIPKGGQAALRFEIRGMVNGRPAIVIEHVTRLRECLRPDWPQAAQPGGSYRVEITGEPSYTVDISPTSRNGDHNHAAIVAAAGRIVNAIPAVVAAAPGIRTTLDLPLITGKGLYAAS